jgi:hypothetical protein
MTMNLKEDCQNNKLTLLAMRKFVQATAVNLGLSLEGPLSTVCEQAQVNRTQVYERKKQIEDMLAAIGLAGPGHPASHSRPVSDQGWRLRESVPRYRLDHPGALALHAGGRAGYSAGFSRFILDLFDKWEGCHEQFCEQVEVPVQTFGFWREKDRVQPYAPRQVICIRFGGQ